MSVHSLAGILAFDLVLVVVGGSLLVGVGLAVSGRDLLRLIGLAWLVGCAELGVLVSIELMLGLSFGWATVIVDVLALVAVAAFGRMPVGRLLRVGHARGSGPLLVSACGISLAALLIDAQFRAARLAGLYEWDAMAFWVPKGKSIYEWGHLDGAFVATLPNAFYPPLIPAQDALSFLFMGGADDVTLHLFYWSGFAAFVLAVAGLLAPRVPAAILWPIMLALVATPAVTHSADSALADITLDYFIALAAVLLAIWLETTAGPLLIPAGIFLAGAALTKREGAALAGCVAASAIAATWRSKRKSWPKLVAVCAPAIAVSLAWSAWLSAKGIPKQGETIGFLHAIDHLGRAWPSLHLTLRVMYGWEWWALAPLMLVIGIVVGVVEGVRTTATFAAVYFTLAVLAASWATFAFPSLGFTTQAATNPIVRVSGAIMIPVASLLPLVLAGVWARTAADAV